MNSHRLERSLDRPNTYQTYHNSYSLYDTLWDRLQQPSVVVPLVLVIFTIFYQSLHSSPLSQPRHPGQLLWDLIVTITPATILYSLDNWLHPPLFPVPKSMLPIQSRSYAAKSELLRKILGMDRPGSLVNSVAHASRRSLSTLSNSAFVKLSTDQPPGLGNYDNSCFQNSILQGLSSLRPLPAYLTVALGQNEADGSEDPGSAATLRDLISKLTDARNNGTTLWTPKKLKSLDTWQQQDAQEYFSKILDEVDKEVTKAARAQHRPLGLEINGVRDETEDSQHSDDSGYQSLTALSKAGPDAKIIRNPLEGLVAQRVACVQCGYSEGLSMIPFNCLTLNLGVGQGGHDLYERLDSYTDLESIQGVECGKCTLLKVQRLLNILISRGRDVGASEESLQEPLSRLEAVELAIEEDDFDEKTLADKCKISKQHRVTSTKTKQMVIARPPQSLAIHINRSVFDEYTGCMSKNLAAVRFPTTLDLGPWCLGSAGISTTANGGFGHGAKSIETKSGEEQWLSDPRSSMVAGDLNTSRITGPIYELRAVITHQGRHENGHYVCYRKHPQHIEKAIKSSDRNSNTPMDEESRIQDDEKILVDASYSEDVETNSDMKWWRLSDETVRPVTEETVLAQGGVFMLFYDCVDPNSVLVPTDYDASLSQISTASSFKIGHVVADYHGDVSENGQQFHDNVSDPKPVTNAPLPTEAISTLEHNDRVVTEGQGPRHKQAEAMASCLVPLLRDGEMVDPIIPLHRPNS
ncbi:cysteine proteinase [Biscogniauxia mediterranea]|nr:cysteine proteinase [Biscogniauxia mediterranea]